MSPDKTKELVAIYPPIFSDLDERSCFRLFSFECSDGWFDLLKDLITQIKFLCENGEGSDYVALSDEKFPLKVHQVKEKYGTLRFYTNWTSGKIREAIEQAEAKSALICEVCGSPGKIHKNKSHWYTTLCDNCIPK
jgi:hypothetical protein